MHSWPWRFLINCLRKFIFCLSNLVFKNILITKSNFWKPTTAWKIKNYWSATKSVWGKSQKTETTQLRDRFELFSVKCFFLKMVIKRQSPEVGGTSSCVHNPIIFKIFFCPLSFVLILLYYYKICRLDTVLWNYFFAK